MKVFLDAGHGGKDPGAVGNGLKEKDIALSVTLKVGEILQRHNIEVIYSRTTDVFLELYERTNKANKAKTDVFVSIHCNSAANKNARGVETFSHIGSIQGAKLARLIQGSLVETNIFSHNRGIKTANFYVIRKSNMPAALTELGFISNSLDAQILKNKQNELAEAVAKGILNYFGIKYKPIKIEKNKIKVRIKGTLHHFDGVYENGTNYVAIRQVAEVLGYKVDWDNKKKEVLIDLRK